MPYRWRSGKPAQRDANEPDIIAELERRGALVVVLDHPVDLAVGYQGAWTLVEIKSGPKARVRLGQAQFLSQCSHHGLPGVLIDHLDDVDKYWPESDKPAA